LVALQKTVVREAEKSKKKVGRCHYS
jgi:hypothetical protein